ncbi:hypothetical protein Psuf_009880 [Phytohabitans suffuscus]|uniref:Uncharacterized protein n=1 Tax=Phytohabitans suffuscus TaxID=624315 RepID=A0A6F8YC34_9ACTN|nr:hypothetical protein Psuf_009880 [Phytohabitans suffuscus]
MGQPFGRGGWASAPRSSPSTAATPTGADLWIYSVGPQVGGIVAVCLYDMVTTGRTRCRPRRIATRPPNRPPRVIAVAPALMWAQLCIRGTPPDTARHLPAVALPQPRSRDPGGDR